MIPESEIRVRLESVRVGQILTFVVCAGAEVYALATWDRPHRVLITALLLVAAASAAAIWLLPIEQIVRGPHRETWFIGWGALDFALVAALAAADGGPHSPFVVLFVLPTIFAASTYPLRSTLATGAMGVAGFVIVAVASGHESPAYDLFVIFALACAGLLAGWQSRNVDAARANLAQTVAALSDSEQRMRMILETAHDAYIAMDRAGRIIEWNERSEEIFGWSRAEALGRAVAETIVPPHFQELHERGLRHYLETGEGPVLGNRVELSAIHRDGHEFPVELTIGAIEQAAGVTFHAFLNDISARKESEAALRRSEMQLRRNRRRLEQAQAIAHMGNWDWDVRANRLTWSEELCRIYGVEPSDCPATFEGYLERVHPDDRERVQATIERALVDRQPFEFDERIVRPNGGIHLLESHGEVHTNADGQVVRVIGVSQDVTTRRPSGSRV